MRSFLGSSMPYRVIVVEDSQVLNELLCEALSQAGYMVTGFLDAESVLEFSGLRDIDIAVLDIQLPGESGLTLSGRLQTLMPRLGILMLTARTENTDRILGYEAGADFYLPKPVSPQELTAAVDSLMRLKQKKLTQIADEDDARFVLEKRSHVLSQGDRSVKLTEGEVDILVALALAPDKRLEHWQIIELLSKDGDTITRVTLDVRLYRLRTKLARFTQNQHTIVSVRKFGYKLGFELEIA